MDDAEANRRIAETVRLVRMTPDEYQADYAARVVGRDVVSRLVVSTAWTGDHGFETAILDAAGARSGCSRPPRSWTWTARRPWTLSGSWARSRPCGGGRPWSGIGGTEKEMP